MAYCYRVSFNFIFLFLINFKNIFKSIIAWFQAVQTLACFSFITNALAVILLIITASTNYRTSVKFLSASAILCFLTCNVNFEIVKEYKLNSFISFKAIFNLITISIFGSFTDTGLKWMPRPEYTFLSWSYICEVFCALFTLIAGLSFLNNLLYPQ